jgi:hypothetical protein
VSTDLTLCPVCGQHYAMRCRCFLAHMVCPAGHEWYRCLVHDRVVIGKADHAKGMDECSCGEGKK